MVGKQANSRAALPALREIIDIQEKRVRSGNR